MIEVFCVVCGQSFKGDRPSVVFEDRRFHMEQRHLEAKIETET